MISIKKAALSALAIGSALCLGACANPKAANESNFEAAIRSSFASQDERQCTQASVSFPATFSDRTEFGPLTNDTTQYDALSSAGLVQKSSRSIHHEATWNPAWTERVTTYSISRDGQRYASTSQGYNGAVNARFCYATKVAGKVTNFTVPGDMGGMTVSQVRYTYTLSDVAPWASNAAIQEAFADVHQTIAGAGTTEESAMLTLTNNGWEVAR
jgi:ribosomal protein S11